MTMTIAATTTTTTTTTSFIGKQRSEQNTRVAGKYLKNIRETSLFFFSYRSRPDLCYATVILWPGSFCPSLCILKAQIKERGEGLLVSG
jgi:hypothetical protein